MLLGHDLKKQNGYRCRCVASSCCPMQRAFTTSVVSLQSSWLNSRRVEERKPVETVQRRVPDVESMVYCNQRSNGAAWHWSTYSLLPHCRNNGKGILWTSDQLGRSIKNIMLLRRTSILLGLCRKESGDGLPLLLGRTLVQLQDFLHTAAEALGVQGFLLQPLALRALAGSARATLPVLQLGGRGLHLVEGQWRSEWSGMPVPLLFW